MTDSLRKIVCTVLLLLCIACPIIAENARLSMIGDEIITYSMANNKEGGFVFSRGRMGTYIKTCILADSVPATLNNLQGQVMDILKNKKKAAIFSTPEESETKYFTQQEMRDIRENNPGDRFDFGMVWLNSQSDESNSYVYYYLLNIAGSLLPAISASRWSGFLVNFLCYAAIAFLMVKITSRLGFSLFQSVLTVTMFALSHYFLFQITLIRSYIFAMVFTLLLLYLHLDYWEGKREKISRAVIPAVFFGYLAHYTNAVVFVIFALVTVIPRIRKKQKIAGYLWSIILPMAAAAVADPMSLIGLLWKFLNARGKATVSVSLIANIKEFFRYIFPGTIMAVISLLIIAAYLVLSFLKKEQKGEQETDLWKKITWITILSYALIMIATKMVKYCNVLYPLMFMLFMKCFFGLFEQCAKIHKTAAIAVFAVYALVFGGLSFRDQMIEEANDSADVLKEREAVGKYADLDCIFFREKGTGYVCEPVLEDFANIQVATVTTPDWETMLDERIRNEDRIVLARAAEAGGELPESWIEEQGYAVTEYYRDNKMILALAEKK